MQLVCRNWGQLVNRKGPLIQVILGLIVLPGTMLKWGSEPMLRGLSRFIMEEDAPTMVEYGLLVALIAIVAVIGVSVFGIGVSNLLQVPPQYF